MLYSCLQSTYLHCRAEPTDFYKSNDLVMMDDNQIFVLRIRVVEREQDTISILNEAMERMRKLDYAQKYCDQGENIHLIVLALHHEGAGPVDIKTESA